jgi:hypothetical protein
VLTSNSHGSLVLKRELAPEQGVPPLLHGSPCLIKAASSSPTWLLATAHWHCQVHSQSLLPTHTLPNRSTCAEHQCGSAWSLQRTFSTGFWEEEEGQRVHAAAAATPHAATRAAGGRSPPVNFRSRVRVLCCFQPTQHNTTQAKLPIPRGPGRIAPVGKGWQAPSHKILDR